jgi:hypothetical protein
MELCPQLALHTTCIQMHKFHDGVSFLLQREKAERERMQDEIRELRTAAKSKPMSMTASENENGVSLSNLIDTRIEVALVRILDDSRLASLSSETERLQKQAERTLHLGEEITKNLQRQSDTLTHTLQEHEERQRVRQDDEMARANGQGSKRGVEIVDVDSELPFHLERLKKVQSRQSQLEEHLTAFEQRVEIWRDTTQEDCDRYECIYAYITL